MGAGKVAVLIMLVVVVAVMVGGAVGDASSSLPISPTASSSLPTSPAADYSRCMDNCQDNDCALPFGIPNPVCKVASYAKCWPSSTADDHHRFCNLGCISSEWSSLITNSGGVDCHDEVVVKDCVRGCADTCNPSSTKLGLGQGRDELV